MDIKHALIPLLQSVHDAEAELLRRPVCVYRLSWSTANIKAACVDDVALARAHAYNQFNVYTCRYVNVYLFGVFQFLFELETMYLLHI